MSLSTSSVASAWRALSWKHLVLTFLFCLAWSALEVGLQSSGFSKFRWSWWGPPVNSLLSLLLNGFVVMLAVLIADQASPPSLRRWWPYVLAVVLGVAIATSLFWLVSQRLFTIPSALQLAGIPEGFDTIAFRHGTNRLVICALATYVYVSHRFAAQRLAALRIVQIERATAERRVLESRLSAMQARVEPQFLVETLAQVERLYDVDAPAADRVLRELTAYLRAAIPRTGDSRSTVATEIRLANTFLNIAAVRSRDRLVLNGGESSGPQGARFPPMVLLPLVKHALTHRVGRAQDDEWFGIDVAVRDEKLVVTIYDRRGGFAPEDESDAEIEQIRDRLAALYGDRGRLALRESEETTAAVLEIPYERIADPVVV
jgi:sensor histidine kinase YesM